MDLTRFNWLSTSILIAEISIWAFALDLSNSLDFEFPELLLIQTYVRRGTTRQRFFKNWKFFFQFFFQFFAAWRERSDHLAALYQAALCLAVPCHAAPPWQRRGLPPVVIFPSICTVYQLEEMASSETSFASPKIHSGASPAKTVSPESEEYIRTTAGRNRVIVFCVCASKFWCCVFSHYCSLSALTRNNLLTKLNSSTKIALKWLVVSGMNERLAWHLLADSSETTKITKRKLHRLLIFTLNFVHSCFSNHRTNNYVHCTEYINIVCMCVCGQRHQN